MAPTDFASELSSGFTGRYIRHKAHQLVGKGGFRSADRPDIEQELALKMVQVANKFNPQRAHWNVFVVTVIERYTATLLHSRFARRRKADFRCCSLNDVAANNCPERSLLDPFKAVDQAIDVAGILKSLPLELRNVCYHLWYDSIAEAGRRLRMSRTSIQRRICRLRIAFRRVGFAKEKAERLL